MDVMPVFANALWFTASRPSLRWTSVRLRVPLNTSQPMVFRVEHAVNLVRFENSTSPLPYETNAPFGMAVTPRQASPRGSAHHRATTRT